jgi:acyl-homoserine lactone acylase PvdQ
VYRDGFGIPHVYGDTDEDAAFALGYVSAEDRLWQMDLLRHAASGTLASFLGPDYAAYDASLRTEGYTEAEVQGMYDALDDDFGADGTLLQDMLVAYADGVNERMAEVRADAALLPAEYYSGGQEIEDWAPTDTIYEAVLQLRQFGETAGNELRNAALLTHLRSKLGRKTGNRAFRDFQWSNDPNAYSTIRPGDGTFPSQDTGAIDPAAVAIPDDAKALAKTVASSSRAIARVAKAFRWQTPASNFIGVSASKSATGHQLQFGAPQVGYTVPQFFMEIDVHSPTFDFRGPALPGASVLVPLGRGIDHAWSLTTGMSDGVDTRVEELCTPGGGPVDEDSTNYLFNGTCTAMESRTETIEVMDGESQEVTIQRTVHGPVIARSTVDGAPVAITKERAFWLHEADTVIAFLRAGKNTLANVDEFSDAMSVATMSFNAVYADPDSLGYFHLGRYPVRAQGVDPMLPTWGTGEWEWSGFMDFADQPHVVNPSQGWLVNWNNQPSDAWANGDTTHWGPTHRVKILSKLMSRLLAGGDTASLSDVVDVIRKAATTDGDATLLGPKMIRRLKAGTGTKRDALAALAEWIGNGGHRVDADRNNQQDFATAVAVWDTWYDRFARRVFNDELKGAYDLTIAISDDPRVNNGSSYYTDLGNVLWNLLGKGPSQDLARDYCDNRTTDKVETCTSQARKAFSQAVASLTKRFGSNPAKWRWPADYIEFSEVGGMSADPIPWQNRGTYNHAIEVLGL